MRFLLGAALAWLAALTIAVWPRAQSPLPVAGGYGYPAPVAAPVAPSGASILERSASSPYGSALAPSGSLVPPYAPPPPGSILNGWHLQPDVPAGSILRY